MKQEKYVTALQTASKNFDACMHSDVFSSILFKLGIIIDTIELYILILVY